MDSNKLFYEAYADTITKKRAESPYPLRRYVHAQQYESVAHEVRPGMRILDAGCGEGVLSLILAARGAEVIGMDISKPNIVAANERAKRDGITNVSFLVGDAEALPFPDNSFDLVVSSHVLEHIPDFDKGLTEIMRVTKLRAVIAIPTALNFCSWVQLGHGWFFLKGPRSFAAFFVGGLRVITAWVMGREGVDEGYAGTKMPHIFRFPRILLQKARKYGYTVVTYEASSLCIPYFVSLLPLIRFLDRFRAKPVFRNCGYGTTYILQKTYVAATSV